MLVENIKEELITLLMRFQNEGKIYSRERLDQYYTLFQRKFSPERLSQLDGELLINTFHNFADRDSLGYWLEFKNDDELPAHFGSIAGGSALKYGIYYNKDKKAWFKGSSTKQIELSISEAIDFVKNQREQLLKGYQEISNLEPNASLQNYLNLQKQLEIVMPDLVDLVWAHKFLAMHFPDILDDYHNPDYQRYHLTKLLILPDSNKGSYINAYYFRDIANELNTSINSLTTLLNFRDGKPQSYWRVGTTTGDGEDRWEMMKNNSCVAIGWDEINQDLSFLDRKQESKNRLKEIVINLYPQKNNSLVSRYTNQLFYFAKWFDIGDLVIAMNGGMVKGIGKVTGEYYFDSLATDFRHRISVRWISTEEWILENPGGLQTTVYELRKYPQNLIDIEKKIQILQPEVNPIVINNEQIVNEQMIEKIKSITERKGQIILYGPPGTGKTYWGRKSVQELASIKNFGKRFGDLTELERNELKNNYIDFCCFHPAYGYEDFIEAFRPIKNNSILSFELKDGIFKRICLKAKNQPEKHFFLIIDEINRGDIPRIFGELITLLETDKRELEIVLPVSGQNFSIPKNISIVGTMNTADRSIALLDTALRRRFGFIEVMPDYSLLKDSFVDTISLESWLKVLNKRICKYLGANGRNLQIGHSYLLSNGNPITEPDKFVKIFREDIIPLLEEYTYEDFPILEKILGKDLVDSANFEINHQLLGEGNWDRIKQALCFDDPDILMGSTGTDSISPEKDEE